jgi:hypothetical protein
VVVLGLLVAGLARLSADERRRERLERIADAVDVRTGIPTVGLGVDGSVVLGVQVTGKGADVSVGEPVLVPAHVAQLSAVGVPLEVGTGRGNVIRLRLRPDCPRVLNLSRVDLELPVTPASGRRHVLRIPFDRGAEMLRRACGYLPPEEALVTALAHPRVDGATMRLDVQLRNDARQAVTVSGVRSPGLEVRAPTAPLTLAEEGAATLPLELRVIECLVTGPLILVATTEGVASGEVSLSYDGAAGSALEALRARACG